MSVNVNTSTNTITIQQDGTRVIQVTTPGPQGPAGPAGGGINTSTFATTGSNTFVGDQIISGNLIPAGPYVNNTSSYNLGSLTQAWKDLYVSNGSVYFLNGNISSSISLDDNGSIALPSASLTGSLLGTASFATTASHTLTASLAPNYVLTSTTSSMLQQYVLTSVTSSMLQPYVLTSATSSMLQPYVLTTSTSSMSVATASLALRASGSLTGSLLGTASWASSSITASYVSGNIFTSTNPALSASYALTASYAMNGGGGPPVDTSTFATTGSNTFVGLQTITGSLNGNVTEVTEATASILDCSTGNFFILNLSPDAITTISLINMSPGQTINLKIRI